MTICNSKGRKIFYGFYNYFFQPYVLRIFLSIISYYYKKIFVNNTKKMDDFVLVYNFVYIVYHLFFGCIIFDHHITLIRFWFCLPLCKFFVTLLYWNLLPVEPDLNSFYWFPEYVKKYLNRLYTVIRSGTSTIRYFRHCYPLSLKTVNRISSIQGFID